MKLCMLLSSSSQPLQYDIGWFLSCQPKSVRGKIAYLSSLLILVALPRIGSADMARMRRRHDLLSEVDSKTFLKTKRRDCKIHDQSCESSEDVSRKDQNQLLFLSVGSKIILLPTPHMQQYRVPDILLLQEST